MKKQIRYLLLLCLFAVSGCQEQSSSTHANNDGMFYENGTDIVSQISSSVVTVYAQDKLGSGVFIAEDKIVTNYHVIEDIREDESIVIKQNNGVFFTVNGVLVKDPQHDLAILQITNNGNMKKISIAKLGNDDLVRQGQEVYAIGSPKGLENTVTQGIISNTSVADMLKNASVFQHDASIDQGSSGGGLFDKTSGDLLGINFSGLAEGKQDAGFAVPVRHLKKILNINSIKVPLTSNKNFLLKIKNQYGQEGATDFGIVDGSNLDFNKMHFLFDSVTTITGRLVIFASMFTIGYLIAYLLFRRAINKHKSPIKSLTSSSIMIFVFLITAMLFSFTDLIFTQTASNPYIETEIVQ